MSTKFDELAKGLAQSVTRRQALKRFGVGLAGMALACFGLASLTQAGDCTPPCDTSIDPCCCGVKANGTAGDPCKSGLPGCSPYKAYCNSLCASSPTCAKVGGVL